MSTVVNLIARITKSIHKIPLVSNVVSIIARLSKNIRLHPFIATPISNIATLIKDIGKKLVANPILLSVLTSKVIRKSFLVVVSLISRLILNPYIHRLLVLIGILEDKVALVMPLQAKVTIVMPLISIDHNF